MVDRKSSRIVRSDLVELGFAEAAEHLALLFGGGVERLEFGLGQETLAVPDEGLGHDLEDRDVR